MPSFPEEESHEESADDSTAAKKDIMNEALHAIEYGEDDQDLRMYLNSEYLAGFPCLFSWNISFL